MNTIINRIKESEEEVITDENGNEYVLWGWGDENKRIYLSEFHIDCVGMHARYTAIQALREEGIDGLDFPNEEIEIDHRDGVSKASRFSDIWDEYFVAHDDDTYRWFEEITNCHIDIILDAIKDGWNIWE